MTTSISSCVPLLILNREIGVAPGRRKRGFIDLHRCIIDQRISTIGPSQLKGIPFSSQNAAGITAMAFDDIEQRFLLCGSARGNVTIVDFESHRNAIISPGLSRQQQRVIPVSNAKDNHKFLITCCQFYPVDSEVFATSSQDKTFKLWDSNSMTVVDKFAFETPITQFHWAVGNSADSSMVAVSIASSNVHLLDPRIGSACHQVRCKGAVSAVSWQRSSNFVLMTGDFAGRIFLWDIRSGRSELAELVMKPTYEGRCSLKKNGAHSNQVTCIKDTNDGQFTLTMSLDKTIQMWDTRTLEYVKTVKISDQSQSTAQTKKPVPFDFCDDGNILWTFIPDGNNVAIKKIDRSRRISCTNEHLLQGHFQSVTAIAYRRNRQELITSANDRLALIWTPKMDEERPEYEQKAVDLHKDQYSDED
uniref:WD_REPEATS_REGION domain-containing protein n=1 Tax=Ditylenchus dipsaci TaxID=166011 RepID=A0A915DGJ7_9BILA